MLAGGWGAQAGELLASAAERSGTRAHRAGPLTMLTAPHLALGDWCCWLFGEPEDRGELAARFETRLATDLPGAFGAALAELGEGACELLCGRFVVVAFDRERERGVVARDQLGAQPLVHTRLSDGVLFAEHERDLLALLPRSPAPDRLALLEWIDRGVAPAGRTLYEGIQRVPAAHRLILSGSKTSVERWWTLRYTSAERASPAALAEQLRDAAFAAVRRAATHRVRPAVKLSGGLDSSCVAAGLAAAGLNDGRALALGGTFADHPLADERELIEATSRLTQLPLELVAFAASSSMLTPQLEHIARWRVPPGTPNLFLWQPLMARARALGVDLMLDGEGGDELFGFAPYLIADRLRAGRVRAAWSLSAHIPGIGERPDSSARVRVLRHYGVRPLVPRAVQRRRERARIASSRSIVPRADAHALHELRVASQEDGRDGPLWWRFQAESLIDQRDDMDMAGHFRREAADAGLDVRHPFLQDLQLIESVLRLPPQAQFDAVRDRPLLRDGLAGLIPETVRTRYVKSHFTTLVLAGLHAEQAGLVDPLHRVDAPVRAYVAPAALAKKIAVAPEDRSMLVAGPLWRVAIANRWLLAETGQGQ